MILLQDQTIKLWDARMLTAAGTMQRPHIFEGHKEPVGGLAVHGKDVISWAGDCMGLFSLQVCCNSEKAIDADICCSNYGQPYLRLLSVRQP